MNELRQRRGWQQERLLDELAFYAPVMHRLEKGGQLPREDSLSHVLDKLGAPLDEFICAHFEGQPLWVYALCDELVQALDCNDIEMARGLYDEISLIEDLSANEIGQQFLLSQGARLLELQGKLDDEILPMVLDGIGITYDDLDENSPGDKVLLFEEPELFHTLARIYARKGELKAAIKILAETVSGLQRLPTGERERDRRVAPLLLSLVDCQLKIGAFNDALDTCELGIHISAIRNIGIRVPDFLLNKAYALQALHRHSDIVPILRMVYAGFLLLGEKARADDVLAKAYDDFGVTFKTYGMENLDIPQVKRQPYKRGAVPACKNIGEMIRILREEAGISLKELSQGICSIANLSKIENNEIKAHMHYVEPILQRLGRDPLLYCNFFLRKDDFEARELRDLIQLLFMIGNSKQASEALKKLKKYKAYKSKANLQFVKRVETILFAVENGDDHPDNEVMRLEALRLTWPNFDEKDISRKPLTLDESFIISGLAWYYMNKGELKRASKIYESLLENIDRRYVDEYEKARVYNGNLIDYTTCLGRMDRRTEALEILDEAENFEQSRGALSPLPMIAANRAYSLYERGEKEKSQAYFAMAYYGFLMFKDYGRAAHIKIAQRLVRERFGFEFD